MSYDMLKRLASLHRIVFSPRPKKSDLLYLLSEHYGVLAGDGAEIGVRAQQSSVSDRLKTHYDALVKPLSKIEMQWRTDMRKMLNFSTKKLQDYLILSSEKTGVWSVPVQHPTEQVVQGILTFWVRAHHKHWVVTVFGHKPILFCMLWVFAEPRYQQRHLPKDCVPQQSYRECSWCTLPMHGRTWRSLFARCRITLCTWGLRVKGLHAAVRRSSYDRNPVQMEQGGKRKSGASSTPRDAHSETRPPKCAEKDPGCVQIIVRPKAPWWQKSTEREASTIIFNN